MTIEEFREKAKDEEYAPGWDAIEEAFAKCYPGQEPNHYGSNFEARAMFGGSEYIDGYSIYKSPHGHRHIVTFGMTELYADEEAFGGEYSRWGCTGFAANEGDVDMVFEDAFTDLQSEFVSLCMEYTGGCVDKIYIYIYQDASQKMFNAIFVKGDRVIPAGNFADDEASDEFLSIGTKDISKLVELCDMYQQKCPNEYKLEFDVATHKFDASYRYDDYTKSGISPVSELMSWYGEIKESM